jgi:hypothetical protein
MRHALSISRHPSMKMGDNDITDGLRFRLVMWFISAMPALINPQ